jgi:hypothetical protein
VFWRERVNPGIEATAQRGGKRIPGVKRCTGPKHENSHSSFIHPANLSGQAIGSEISRGVQGRAGFLRAPEFYITDQKMICPTVPIRRLFLWYFVIGAPGNNHARRVSMRRVFSRSWNVGLGRVIR